MPMSDEPFGSGARLKINISDEEYSTLVRLACKEGISVTHLVRRMIQVYDFLEQRVDNENSILRFFNTKTKNVTVLHLD